MNTPSKVSAYSFHTKQNVVGAVSCSFTHRPYVYVFIESIQDLGYSGLGSIQDSEVFQEMVSGQDVSGLALSKHQITGSC